MSGTASVGQGDLTFGTLASEFEAAAGLAIDGKTTVSAKCTPASAVTETYKAGNMADYGVVTGTIIVDTTAFVADLDTLIGTEATLVVAYPLQISTNGTVSGWTGTAIFESAPQQTTVNEILRATATFRWTGKPTPIVEAV